MLLKKYTVGCFRPASAWRPGYCPGADWNASPEPGACKGCRSCWQEYGPAACKPLAELADVLGLCPAGSRAAKARVFIDAIYRMNRALGIPECFPCIRSEDLPQMAAWAEANPVYPVPVIFGKEDFIRVARRVMP